MGTILLRCTVGCGRVATDPTHGEAASPYIDVLGKAVLSCRHVEVMSTCCRLCEGYFYMYLSPMSYHAVEFKVITSRRP